MIITHAPWRDELQAYLLVRDSQGLGALFANLHYEGHPSLWYLVLSAAQTVFRGPRVLMAVQMVVALGTTTLVWTRAPFTAWLKLLILAGYYLLFEYGVIARSYGLGALLLFAWLALRRTPWGWLMLALMANVAVHFTLLSAACALATVWIERRWALDRRAWAGLALWAAACLAAAVTIIPAHDLQTGLSSLAIPLTGRLIDALRRQSAVLLPALVGVWPYHWQVLLSAPAAPLLGLLSGLLAALAVGRAWRASVVILGLFLALVAMCALLYPTYLRHVGVLVLLLIALEWMRLEGRGEPASPVFVGWMTFSAACGLWTAACALWLPFSPGPQGARWIAAHHLQNAAWAAYPGYVGSDIAAVFDRPTYNLQKQCLNTFIRWDRHAYDDVDDDLLAQQIEAPGPYAYLASNEDLAPLEAPMHLIARFGRGMSDDDLFLYALDRPQQGVAAACPGLTRPLSPPG